MRIYLAGPMTGHPQFNFPAFDAAARALRQRGHEVFSPAEEDRRNGFNPEGLTGHEDLAEIGFSLRHALQTDLSWICESAEAVVYLPGIRHSRGAQAEIATANALHLPVYPIAHALELSC